MTPPVHIMMLGGQNPEPFSVPAVEAALPMCQSTGGKFLYANTEPDGGQGEENERIVRRIVPREMLIVEHVRMSESRFSFAKPRNTLIEHASYGDYLAINDMDEVCYPEWVAEAQRLIDLGHDIITSHYFHLAAFKNCLHSVRHREVLFRNGPGVSFDGDVHERLIHPRQNPAIARGYHLAHYGYCQPARRVAAKWEFYRARGAEIHEYDRDDPDHALDDWPRICTPFWREHPPAVRELLESYPTYEWPQPSGPTVALLVLLTWDDVENLRTCLESLWTTEAPFWLVAVDNGSTDGTIELLREYQTRVEGGNLHGDGPCRQFWIKRRPGFSLAQALNVGFSEMDGLTGDYTPPYIGWIHPDHIFDWPNWLGNLVEMMDHHPHWSKLGCQEAEDGGNGLRPGNSQCYIVRRTALEQVGLFDERFLACGGWEDWEHNARLLKFGPVMITPTAMVRHEAMQTRQRHDNVEAARQNADLYHQITGQWEPFV